MIISFEQVGLWIQIGGVLLVLFSQVLLWYRARRKFGSLKKTFFAWLAPVRIGEGMSADEIKNIPEEHLKEKFPNGKWAFACFMRDDILTSSIGIIVTVIGLLCELSSLTLIV